MSSEKGAGESNSPFTCSLQIFEQFASCLGGETLQGASLGMRVGFPPVARIPGDNLGVKQMAIAIDKQDRETAKRERLYLFQIMVDGRHLKAGYGMSSSSGACSKKFADKLRKLIRDYGSEFRVYEYEKSKVNLALRPDQR